MTNNKSLFYLCLLVCIFSSCFAENYPQTFPLQGANWTGTCATGHTQSPINIETNKVVCDVRLGLAYEFADRSVDTNITFHGNFDFTNSSRLMAGMYNKDTYQLSPLNDTLYAEDLDHHDVIFKPDQTHFHSPSQHLVDGQRFDMEIHMIHTATAEDIKRFNLTRTIAVIALLFSVDDYAEENPLINALDFNNVGASLSLNFNELLTSQIGENPEYYAYRGSLTSPPCDEIVNFYVVKQVLKLTTAQLKPIINMLAGNGDASKHQGWPRIPNKLHNRVVYQGNSECENRWHKP